MKPFCTVVKVKGKVFPVFTVKVYRGRRGIIQEPFVTKVLNEGKKV
jgi:hypothetical protein